MGGQRQQFSLPDPETTRNPSKSGIRRMGEVCRFAPAITVYTVSIGDDLAGPVMARNPVNLRLSMGYVFQGIGLFPHMRAGLAGFIAVVSMVPPLALLPILFIVFGLGELSKVVLIVIGITPFLIRDLSQLPESDRLAIAAYLKALPEAAEDGTIPY